MNSASIIRFPFVFVLRNNTSNENAAALKKLSDMNENRHTVLVAFPRKMRVLCRRELHIHI